MEIYSPLIATTPQRVAELDRLGDEIAELSAHVEAATARLLDLIREFDARGGWDSGFRSRAAWLSWGVGLDLGAARERVRVARALGSLPLLAQALARAELSYAKVRALTRVATPETEERLLGVGRAGTAAHVERIVRGWRCVDRRAEARETKRQHASRSPHVYADEDGTVVLRGWLAPEVGALLLRALAAARETLYQQRRGEQMATPPVDRSSDLPTMAQRQADALALIAETALHHGLDPGAPGERYQVVVHVDAPVLADPEHPGQSVLEDGVHVPAETPRRLACDASRVVMQHDEDGRVVEVGSANADDSPGVAARAAPPGPRLPLPGLRAPIRRGASRAPLGARRADDAVEPRAPLSPAPSRGTRGGLQDRSTARRRAPVPSAGRPPSARCPTSRGRARGSRPGPQRAARRAGAEPPCTNGVPLLARGAPESGLGDRRLASSRDANGGDGMITFAVSLRA